MRHCLVILLFCTGSALSAQDTSGWWHGIVRKIHYQPQGNDFILANGNMRFNRALYGTNTAFRVETGDLPEFALYMPGMGGNFKLGLINGSQSKWLTCADSIQTIYRPGSMLYEIRDAMISSTPGGYIGITVLALGDGEGMIIKVMPHNCRKDVKLVWAFGGASGKKFSRDGDIGADPESSFYLKAENCRDNNYELQQNSFTLLYGSGKVLSEEERYGNKPMSRPLDEENNAQKKLTGVFPAGSQIKEVDASKQDDPLKLFASGHSPTPAVAGMLAITKSNEELYFLIRNPGTEKIKALYTDLPQIFKRAEAARKKIAGRVTISTPDPYINTLAGALCIAADAIWEDPSFMHGAVAWRMRLPAWRGPYAADPLGWHDRARTHFSSYALSQVTAPDSGPVIADTALHLARQLEKMGTSVFSSGYISRNPGGRLVPHHYDMNLVYVDELLNHFNWTGDTAYVKKMWPLLQRHLAWEKRNFDPDGDGLYDAYAAIWASDALQYSGGGVTHSSAYNYRSNNTAAQLARLIGEDGGPYEKEADKILKAMNGQLWLPDKGWYAEYRDLLGNKNLHPSAALWSVYHAIDSKVPDKFQTQQLLHYVDEQLPHIPVKAAGLNKKDLSVLGTTNWQPYEWSLNNVVFAENQHMALAYWQGGRAETAYKLFESSLIETMYLGASPGGFQQLSFYDAVRGELYRDFADGIGMTARALVEGLFGIHPDALNNRLAVQPGWPAAWTHASLSTPDISIDFKRRGNTDSYAIRQSFAKNLQLHLLLTARGEVSKVLVNDHAVSWKYNDAVGAPTITVDAGQVHQCEVKIIWRTQLASMPVVKENYIPGENVSLAIPGIVALFDPQHIFSNVSVTAGVFRATIDATGGSHTAFLYRQQNEMSWWQPLALVINGKTATVMTNTGAGKPEMVDLAKYFNDKVTQIFRNQYLSPRPAVPTLQLPTQGTGEWTHPLLTANIDDNGLRKLAAAKDYFTTPQGIPFRTPSDTTLPNILFTSRWDNYPKSVHVPLEGNASRACLLMAGSTNPMQSRIRNGIVYIRYTDGSADSLSLDNPTTWWPIEQDYYEDGYAFTVGTKPLRVHLKTGEMMFPLMNSTRRVMIDGGAATVLELALDKGKKLKELELKTTANDVVIGLMSLTLMR